MATTLTTEQQLDIDDLLQKVEARTTNAKEIRRLQYMNFDPSTDEENYKAVEVVLNDRAKTDYSVNAQLELLYEYAEEDGIDMGQTSPTEVIPTVHVMYVGGKL